MSITKEDVQRHLIAEFSNEAAELEQRAADLGLDFFVQDAKNRKSLIQSVMQGDFEYSLEERMRTDGDSVVPRIVVDYKVADVSSGRMYIDLPIEHASDSVQSVL